MSVSERRREGEIVRFGKQTSIRTTGQGGDTVMVWLRALLIEPAKVDKRVEQRLDEEENTNGSYDISNNAGYSDEGLGL